MGDPLANGLEFFTHCVSADRVVGRSRVAVLQAVDEQEAKLSFLVIDITEGWMLFDGLAELDLAVKGVFFGSSSQVLLVVEAEATCSAALREEANSRCRAAPRWSKVETADSAVRSEQERRSQ